MNRFFLTTHASAVRFPILFHHRERPKFILADAADRATP
jgi:hypothetical protein